MSRSLTPVQRHLQRHVSANLQAATAAAEPDRRYANAHELQLLQLADHRRQLKGIQSIERKIELKATLLPLYDATDSHDMPDEVRAKLLKARGVSLIGAGQLESALADLRRAHLLHEKCGVKKLIETTERALKKLTDPAPEAKAKPTAKPAAKADTPDTASPGPTAAAS